MECLTCSSGSKEKVRGCNNNGSCGTGSCNKKNAFDWLSHMDLPMDKSFNVVEVRFKNGRKEFYKNDKQLDLITGDAIVVEANSGYHIGYVSLQGEIVRLQLKKKKVKNHDHIASIQRIAEKKDLEKLQKAKDRELSTLFRGREIINELKLDMKLSYIEYHADNSKAIFFYSAEGRVDFRELIKKLAAEFKIRVEMKQISLRHEAGLLGGIGSCGKELCCSTWLSDFKTVSTAAARYQNLALNPSKLSGQCGRLKCCLNYELDTYMDALKSIPKVSQPIQTEKGTAYLKKTDIFRKKMWFSYNDESTWHPIAAERVYEILDLIKQGEKVFSLTQNAAEVLDEPKINSDLEYLDNKFKKKEKKKKKGKNNKNRRNNKQKQNRSDN